MNDRIKELISNRLDVGAKTYSAELDVLDGRNWSMEALEEALDLSVYLGAEIMKRTITNWSYLFTMRRYDEENFAMAHIAKEQITERDDLKKIAFEICHTDYAEMDDWKDVYIVCCWEVSPSGAVKNVMPTGANVFYDWVKEEVINDK